MGALRNLVVKITGDTAGLQKSLGAAQRSVQTATTGIGKTMAALNTGFYLAAGAATAAGIAIVAAARETMPMYAESLEAETKLVTVMRQRMGASNALVQSVLDLANAEQRTGVVEGDAVVAGQQQLATFLHNADALKTLTPAMADLVAQQQGYKATAEGTTTIANLMGKVMDGNTAALKKVGISFSEAEGNILKTGTEMERAAMLAKIIANNVGDMNQALGGTEIGKLAQVTNAWGDMKETLGGAFTKIIADMAPALMKLIELLQTAAMWAMAFVDVLSSFIPVGESSAAVQGDQAATGKDLAKNNKKVADSQDKVAKSTTGAAKAAAKWLAGFDQINKVQKASAGGGTGFTPDDIDTKSIADGLANINKQIDDMKAAIAGLMGDPNSGLGTWLLGLKTILGSDDPLGTFWQGLKDMFSFGEDWKAGWAILTKDFTDWFKKFGQAAQAILSEIYVDVFQPGFENIGAIASAVWNGILTAWNATVNGIKKQIEIVKSFFRAEWNGMNEIAKIIWGAIGSAWVATVGGIKKQFAIVNGAFAAEWNGIKQIASIVWGAIKSAWAAEVSGIRAQFKIVYDAATAVWNGLKAGASAAWSGIKNAFTSVGSYFSGRWSAIKSAFSGISSWFSGRFSEAWTAIKSVFSSVGTFFDGMWSTIKGKFTSIGTSIGGAVGGAFKSAVNSVFATIENIVNGFIRTINGIIKILNSIPGVNIGNIGTISLPRLANGGIATSPTLAMIGDNRGNNGEAVLPLSGNTAWADVIANKLALAGGGGGDIYISLDGQSIGYAMERKKATNKMRSNGR